MRVETNGLFSRFGVSRERGGGGYKQFRAYVLESHVFELGQRAEYNKKQTWNGKFNLNSNGNVDFSPKFQSERKNFVFKGFQKTWGWTEC